MSRPIIVTCALTGAGNIASPHVPVTPAQIADEALAAHAAGAAIVHIHVRDPETGKPSLDLSLYREVVRLIRAAKCGVLINLTTGVGARFVPDEADPNRNSLAGMETPEARIAHVLELRPDICSLDVATMNFSNYAFINTPQHIERMAASIRAAGIKPELEVFDLGHASLANHLYRRGLFADPPWLQICLGIPWGAPATTEAMVAMKQMVPPSGRWSAFGIASQQFPMVAQSVILGGHARVGLEDNIYLAKGQLAPGNASLVERAVRIIKELGAEIASPTQTREILCLA
jgi:uncharacterized protein (DUF849 family)